jgi:hypothetical protein
VINFDLFASYSKRVVNAITAAVGYTLSLNIIDMEWATYLQLLGIC